MRVKRNRYTDDFRASAVLMLEAAGYPQQEGALTRVSQHLGVPHQTLSRWGRGTNNPAPPDLVREKRLDMQEMLQHILFGFSEEILRRVTSGELVDEPLNHLMTGYGIAFDKHQLATGGPTGNVNVHIVRTDDAEH